MTPLRGSRRPTNNMLSLPSGWAGAGGAAMNRERSVQGGRTTMLRLALAAMCSREASDTAMAPSIRGDSSRLAPRCASRPASPNRVSGGVSWKVITAGSRELASACSGRKGVHTVW